jgi:hypothetical protein
VNESYLIISSNTAHYGAERETESLMTAYGRLINCGLSWDPHAALVPAIRLWCSVMSASFTNGHHTAVSIQVALLPRAYFFLSFNYKYIFSASDGPIIRNPHILHPQTNSISSDGFYW